MKEFFTHNLFNQEIKLIEKKNTYKYNVVIIPKNDDFCSDPDVFYSVIEAHYLKLNFPEIDLLPFCSGGLINCIYLINVKINFDSMATTDETISIPIELYYTNDKNSFNNNEIKLFNPYNEIFKDNDNINENLNINSLNDYKIKEQNGFEIIEQEDFIKALNSDISKPQTK